MESNVRKGILNATAPVASAFLLGLGASGIGWAAAVDSSPSAIAAAATAVAEAVVRDPAPDREHPASMDSVSIPSGGSSMYATIYLASGVGLHPTLVLLHGFPGNEQNLDLAQAARRAGWNALAFHYRGAWASQGTFSFAHGIEDVSAAVTFLCDPKVASKYQVDSRRIVLLGHSYGGFLAAMAGSRDARVRGVAILDGWNLGKSVAHLTPAEEKDTLDDFADSANVLAGCTAAGLLAEARAHAAEWNYVTSAAGLATRPVMILGAERDDGRDNAELAAAVIAAGGMRVTAATLPTDHFFSDRRIEVASRLVGWLGQFR